MSADEQYATPVTACDGVHVSTLNLSLPLPFLPLKDTIGAQIVNGITSRYFVFEYFVSLAYKFCAGKILLPSLKFGLAAYDVNYDHGTSNDTRNLCDPKVTRIGNFARLYIIRKMRDAFARPDIASKTLRQCVDEALL
ncbi:hypothetical protein MTO96_004533 [Rhipicephalus appendiculatus]